MAIYINLLPWRQAQQEKAKKQFVYQALSVAMGVGLVLTVVHFMLATKIQAQAEINSQLSLKVKHLEQELAAFSGMQQQRDNILAKMQIIDFLQNGRTMPIKTLDGIPRCLPEGIALTSMAKTAEQITLEGQARDPKLISDFMRQLEATGWFDPPQLIWVQNDTFQLNIKEKKF